MEQIQRYFCLQLLSNPGGGWCDNIPETQHRHQRCLMKRMLLVVLFVGLYITPAWAQNPAAVNLMQQGDALVKSGTLKPAIAAYKGAIAIDPKFMEPYGALSTVYLKTRKYKNAVKLLRKAIKQDPKYPTAWYNMAYALRKLKRLDGAIKAYKAFARLKPANADAYFGLGLAYEEKGDLKGAAAAFRTYAKLEKRPGRKDWVAKALANAEALERKAAPPAPVTPAIRPAPVMPPAVSGGTRRTNQQHARRLKARGDALVKAGRLDEAVAMYKGAIASDSTYTAAYTELGTTLFGLNRFADAINPLRTALRDNPKYHQGWYNLAYALRKSRRYGAAIGAYRKYIQARPSESDPYFGLGLAYQALNNKKMAIWAFKTYMVKEKRPAQARWVQKARTEVAKLEGTAAPVVAAKPTPDRSKDVRKDDLAAMAAPLKEKPRGRSTLPWRRKRGKPARPRPAKKLGKLLPVVVAAPEIAVPPPGPTRPARDVTGDVAAADHLAVDGKHKAAYLSYVRVVKADPFQVKAFDGLVYCAYKLRAYKQGIGAMKMATRDNPGYVRGWLYRGRIERAWGKPVDAAGSFRRYLHKKPADLDVQLELARTLKQARMKDGALAAYTHYLKNEKRKDAASKIVAAHLEMKALGGKPPAARIWLEGVKKPMTVAAYFKRKEAEKAAAEAAAAEAAAAAAAPPVVEKAPAVKPPSTATVPAAGVTRKPATDAEGLAKAVTGDMSDHAAPPRVHPPDSPGDVIKSAQVAARNLIVLGDQAFSKRHYAVALGLYHQASKLDPSSTEGLYKAGVAAMSLGQMHRAARLFGMVLKLDPKNKMARINLKLTYAAAGKPRVGAKQKSAVMIIKGSMRKRQFALAEQQANKALQTTASATLYYLRAKARLSRRKARAALDDGGRALALNPGLADAIKLMGDAHRLLRGKKRALYYYKLYLNKTASDARYARGRVWVERVVKRLETRGY